jgi:plasmid stabilization system protein ParE
MNLEFHPAVQRDVNEITAYYEREASAELADRFFNAVLAQLALVAAHPERCSPYPPCPRFQRSFIPGLRLRVEIFGTTDGTKVTNWWGTLDVEGVRLAERWGAEKRGTTNG